MEETLGDTISFNNIVNGFRLVVSIRVQCLIGDDMVLQKSLKVFLPIFAEQKAIDPRSQLLEGEVSGGEDRSTYVVGGVCDSGQEAGLCEAKFKGTELAGEK